MKHINKLSALSLALGGALAFAGCSDIDDMLPQGGSMTEDKISEAVAAIPSRVAAEVAGMYSLPGQQYVLGNSGYANDFGYPSLCISQDANGADYVTDPSDYNWFSVSSEYAERDPGYIVAYFRYLQPYTQVRQCNSVIASIGAPSESTKATLGQALAMRAFAYMSLVPYYQFGYSVNPDAPCVPLVTESTADTGNNPRASVRAVYEFMLDDLTKAIEYLDGFARPNKTIIDLNVAYGLRARVNLSMGRYAEAASDAEKALSGYTPATSAEVSTPAFCNLSEHNWIWGIEMIAENMSSPSALASWPSKLCSFTGNGYTTGVGCYKHISTHLYKKIPATDVRRGWWVDENLESPLLEGLRWEWSDNSGYHVAEGQDIAKVNMEDVKVPFDPYTNVKFGMKSGVGSVINNSDWCLMRAEEMILIQAEGLAMSNRESEAVLLLEGFLKANRDPQYTCMASSSVDLQTEIWKQRRIELWGEGFSMYDIMRLNKPVVRILGSDKGNWPDAHAFNIAADDPWLLLRFSNGEMSSNAACVQNTGGTLPQSGQNPNLRDGVTD